MLEKLSTFWTATMDRIGSSKSDPETTVQRSIYDYVVYSWVGLLALATCSLSLLLHVRHLHLLRQTAAAAAGWRAWQVRYLQKAKPCRVLVSRVWHCRMYVCSNVVNRFHGLAILHFYTATPFCFHCDDVGTSLQVNARSVGWRWV